MKWNEKAAKSGDFYNWCEYLARRLFYQKPFFQWILQVIEGSQKTYTFADIKALIDPVRESIASGAKIARIGSIPFVTMNTNTHKLREKVIELLEKEYKLRSEK